MKKGTISLSIIGILLMIFATGCLTQSKPKTGEIFGLAIDLDDNPVAGITIKLGDEETTTDAEGAFSFEDVEYGTYTLAALEDGYMRNWKEVVIQSESTLSNLRVGNLISNFDFSQGVDENDMPVGFKRSGPEREGVTFGITDEKASIGQYSLKMVDDSAEFSLWINSESFPASPGQTFRAEVDAMTEKGYFQLYLEFRQGTQRLDRRQINLENQSAEWKNFSVELDAPDGTDGVIIYLYSTQASIATGYVDNVRLYPVD